MVEMISEIPEDVAGGHVTTRLTTQEDGRYLRQYCNDNRRHRMKNRGDSRYYTLSDLVCTSVVDANYRHSSSICTDVGLYLGR